MLDKIVEACHFLLNNYPEAQASKAYLDTRLNQESQERFQFGYFPNTQHMSSLTDLVGEDVLRQERLFYTRDIEDSLSYRRIPNCYFEHHPLVMPFRNIYGQPVGLVGRTLLNENDRKKTDIHKYKNTAESPVFKKGNLLFGLYENKQTILDRNCVYVVEGQFDVIKASEVGFRNVVALGNSGMTDWQYSAISRYANNIFLLLDNDEAGRKGREQIVGKYGGFANIRNAYVPSEYKDVDEYLTKERIGDWAEMRLVEG